MDWGPLGQIIGGIGLAGGLVLALLRYLTSDGGYRDLIGELRADNAELRDQLDAVQVKLDAAQTREEALMAEVRRLQQMIAPSPPWPPPGPS